MIIKLVYNRQTPSERQMTALGKELERNRVDFELVDADSVLGIGMVDAYELFARPAVLVVDGAGSVIQQWQGEQIPLVADIIYAAHQ